MASPFIAAGAIVGGLRNAGDAESSPGSVGREDCRDSQVALEVCKAGWQHDWLKWLRGWMDAERFSRTAKQILNSTTVQLCFALAPVMILVSLTVHTLLSRIACDQDLSFFH